MTSTALHGARRDISIMGLIGLAHGLSHFLQLALPSMFLAIRADLGVSFAALGMATTVFYVVSGLCQTAAGFAVDRFGAPRILIAGLGLFALGVGAMGLAPSFGVIVACAIVAGIGNSVFHPADFGILNASITPKRLGPAFSVHGISGNIGWALAPSAMAAFALWFGGWRGALLAAAGVAFAALALVVARRDLFAAPPVAAGGRAGPAPGSPAVLLSMPIQMCFLFFLLLAAGLIGVQNFGIPTLNQIHRFSPEAAAVALTTFLLASGAGVLCGGIVAARATRHEHVAAAGMAAAAGFVALVALAGLPAWAVLACLAAAGFATGLTNPSRDMIVRAAAPPGSTGKVYGFVYSGLDAGSALAPILFGMLLDRGAAAGVVFAIAVLWLVSIATIYLMAHASRRRG
ncbi:MAG: MFS transporter [Burkholderiales bacterium]|nr:MFS transporter [Burkholderiales bacterium]